MKSALFILVFLSGHCTMALSQRTVIQQNMGRLSLRDTPAFDNRYQGVKGSPYIMKEWHGAILYPTDQPSVRVEYMNFDRYTLELCYRENPEGKIQVLNKYLIDSFVVFTTMDTLEFVRVRPPGTSDFSYMEKVFSGTGNLYLDRAKRFVEADYEQVYSADRRYDEFKDAPVCYITLNADVNLQEVSRNRKQMASLFGTHQARMLQFFKSEKVSFTDRADLILMMKHYQEISE